MYKLDPEQYGFHHKDKYPELSEYFGNTTYIKVTSHLDNGKMNYWFTAIALMNHDSTSAQYQVFSGVYTKGESLSGKGYNAHTKYSGIISNEAFAENLLCHLMGTWSNDSVETYGRQRLDQSCLVQGRHPRQKTKE